MAFGLTVAARNAVLDAIAIAVDAGTDPGYIDIYTGDRPVDADATDTGTYLCTVTLNSPPFTAAAADGEITLDVTGPPSGIAGASGEAGWCRMRDSDGNNVLDGTVGEEFFLDNTTITSGNVIILVAVSTIAMGA